MGGQLVLCCQVPSGGKVWQAPQGPGSVQGLHLCTEGPSSAKHLLTPWVAASSRDSVCMHVSKGGLWAVPLRLTHIPVAHVSWGGGADSLVAFLRS